MKKVLITIIALIMVSCSLFAIGCKDDVKAKDENSWVVSFYLLEKNQDAYGEVEDTGFAHWKSVKVVKSKMVELEGYDKEYDYYNYIGGSIKEVGEKAYFLPDDNATIYVRKRAKKTINFYVAGINISDPNYRYMTEDVREEYRDKFVDTYEESFHISSTMTEIFKKASFASSGNNLKFEFYTTKNFSGKPFFTYNEYSYYNLQLIKSTDVYVRVIYTLR